jgi:protein TonB
MALRALLFSKNPETADSLAAILKEMGVHAEVCADIFAGMEKGTKQPFASLIVDWSEQPEAGFLLKRARESGLNRTVIAVAIVENDPSPDEEREHRLDFLIYRPIVADEARAVLGKVRQQMQSHSAATGADGTVALDHPEMAEPLEHSAEDPNLVSIASELPESVPQGAEEIEETNFDDERRSRTGRPRIEVRPVLAAVLALTAIFCLWKSRETFRYLAQTPEGTFHVLRDSLVAMLNPNKSAVQAVGADASQDAYFARSTPSPAAQSQGPAIGVVSADIGLPEKPMHAPYDFPLPMPEMYVDPTPAHVERAAVPDSLKTSAPISRPLVVTVNPQVLPVSTVTPTSTPSWQQSGEPVHLSEDSARALVLHSVDPEYPPEAMAQKLHGPVVLQTMIARDGTVEDVKLIRGYFVLAKAAIAAVKQWKFRPYNANGRALQTQTVITINFSYPPG